MPIVTISGTDFEVQRVSDYCLKVRMPGEDEYTYLVAPDNDCISWRFKAQEPNYFLAYMLQREFYNTNVVLQAV